MKIKAIVKTISIIIPVLLASCVGEATNSSNQGMSGTQYTNKFVEAKNRINNQIPIDNSVIINDTCNYTAKSADGNITMLLKACIGANYIASSNGELNWVNPNYMTGKSFSIQFGKNGAPKDFHLERIYNDNQGSGVDVGRIKQIDTTSCDKLIQIGPEASANKSCNISFVYYGMEKTSKTNTIHLQFSGGGVSNLVDFAFPVSNHKIFDQLYANLGQAGNSNVTDINYMLNSTEEDDGGTGLLYQNQYYDEVNNNGLATLSIPKEVDPENDPLTIEVMKSAYFGNSGDMYFSDYLNTSCGKDQVKVGDSCKVLFNSKFDAIKSDSQYGYFNYKYYPSESSSQQTYASQFVLSQGDIENKDYNLNYNNLTFDIIKFNVEDEKHGALNRPSYSLDLKDFELHVRYDPKFYIGYQKSRSGLEYAYGGNLQDLLSSLQVKLINPDCIKNPFGNSSEVDDHFDPSRVECKVEIKSNKPELMKQFSEDILPVAFQLYATYASPTQHKRINQLIGNINISSHKDQKAPEGTYIQQWPKVKFDGTTLEVFNDSNPAQNYSSLDYEHTCAKDSTVSTLTIAFWDFSKSSNAYYIYPLKCDSLSARFPKGNYDKTCVSLEYKNGMLQGACEDPSYRTKGFGDTLNPTSLDYVHACEDGSSVSNINGNFVCDNPKNN